MPEHDFVFILDILRGELRSQLQGRWTFQWKNSVRGGIHHRVRSLVRAMRWLEVRVRTECNPARHPVGGDLVKDLLVWDKGQRRRR